MDLEHNYGFGVTTQLSIGEAEQCLRSALAEEGFGILTEIDVTGTLKAKLGVEWVPYRILGACNPQLAHRGLLADDDIGLLLPCNVVLYRKDGVTVVKAMDPNIMARITENAEVGLVAGEARERLGKALHKIPQRASGD